jgi:hypothetical protein
MALPGATTPILLFSPRMRGNSCRNLPITDSTTISVATPSAMLASEKPRSETRSPLRAR